MRFADGGVIARQLFWNHDEALEAEGPCNVREKQPDGTFLMLPRSQWEAVTTAGSDPARAVAH